MQELSRSPALREYHAAYEIVRSASVISTRIDPAERTAAAGITGVARTTGAAFAPVVAMPLIASVPYGWIRSSPPAC